MGEDEMRSIINYYFSFSSNFQCLKKKEEMNKITNKTKTRYDNTLNSGNRK